MRTFSERYSCFQISVFHRAQELSKPNIHYKMIYMEIKIHDIGTSLVCRTTLYYYVASLLGCRCPKRAEEAEERRETYRFLKKVLFWCAVRRRNEETEKTPIVEVIREVTEKQGRQRDWKQQGFGKHGGNQIADGEDEKEKREKE